MSTLSTLARRIARVNKNDPHAVQLGLVLNKHSQLKETPTMPLCSVSLFSPNPRTNALEVFQGDPSLRVFSFQNNRFADFVIQFSGKAFLFQRSFLQKTLRRLRILALKFRAQSAMPLAQVPNVRTTKALPVAVGSDASNTQINAQEAIRLIRGRLNHVDGAKEKPSAFAENQIAFTLARVQQHAFTRATDEGNLLAPVERPDRNVIQTIAQNPVIIGHRAVLAENPLLALVEFISIGDFGNYAHGHLSRQAELITDSLVGELVQLELTESLGLPGCARGFIGGGIRSLKCLFERGDLLGSRFKFQPDSQFHRAILIQSLHI